MYSEKKADEWLGREKAIMDDVEGWVIDKKNYSTRWTVPTPGKWYTKSFAGEALARVVNRYMEYWLLL